MTSTESTVGHANNSTQRLRQYVGRSIGLPTLARRVVSVLQGLPKRVLDDFLEDSRFRLAMDDFAPETGRRVWIASPGAGKNGSRCVVLKARLGDCPEDFAHYVIAHELAHAYLRNGGWESITDPERAADSLAGTWGFSRPVT